MAKMIQIRNVPDKLHRTLKARAAEEGMSLSDYLLSELKRVVGQPTLTRYLEGLHRRDPSTVRESPADVIRAERDAR